jgi:hypothetical protein
VAGLHGFHAGDTIQIVDTSHSSAVVGSYVILDSDLYYGDDYFTISKFSDTARSTVDINLDTLADGAHTLAARIVDVAGNIATASGTTTVTIDGKIPLMSTSAPLEDATGVSTGLTKLTFTFNENIAIADGTIVTITDDNNSNNYQEITLSSSGQRQQADHQPEQRAHQRHLLYRDRRHRHRPGRQCRHHRRYAAAALHHRGHLRRRFGAGRAGAGVR